MSPSNRPRLLQVLYSFGIGGSELVGLDLAEQLAACGIEVVCTSIQGVTGPLASRCKDLGIPVVDLGFPKKGILERNGISWSLSRQLASLNTDTLHLQHFLSLNKLGLPARVGGVPRIVVTEHSVLDASQTLAGRLRIRANWRLADMITTVHPQIESYLVRTLGVSASRVTSIPVGIDISRWHRADREACRRDLGIRDEYVFAFVGRFASVKDVPGLVRSYLSAASRIPQKVRLLLAGDGEDMTACRDIARGNHLGDTISFLGELSDTRPVLAAADAFVMNSLSEGTPRALLEAMAMELTCICPAVGGIPSILENRGYLFERGPNDELSLLMVGAVSNPSEGRILGAHAAEYVRRNYSFESVLREYANILFPGFHLSTSTSKSRR